MAKKVLVGLSGGVDSAVTAYLLKKQGFEVVGACVDMWDRSLDIDSDAIFTDVKAIAEAIGIPCHFVDFKELFRCNVRQYFEESYLQGRTPNPCVRCNRTIKWEALISLADELGCEQIATGHYANILTLPDGRLSVANAKSTKKDQTYALCELTQEQLRRTIMPLGAFTKEEIREIAKEAQIPVAQKKDSQDICFIPDGDFAAYIEQNVKKPLPPKGNFVDRDGKILGQHEGILHYTIGQRKGLGIAAGHRVVVTEIRPKTNEVVIGENEDVFATSCIISNVNYMGIGEVDSTKTFLGKIRYAHAGELCHLEDLGEGNLRVIFESPVRAITPGQFFVCYEEDHIALAGTIEGI